MTKEYTFKNGTAYDTRTHPHVIEALENARQSRRRVRIWEGDTTTGRAWAEENDVTGYIGRSTGTYKIPLLVKNARSLGGPALLEHCILKIVYTDNGRVLYQHPQFHTGDFSVIAPSDMPEYAANVTHNGELYARTKTANAAQRLVDFMTGKRFNK